MDLDAIIICGMLFIGAPWIMFHYITQWKKTRSLSVEDENLLDGLHEMARRLDDRLATIERIVAADNPNWRPGSDTTPRDPLRDPLRDQSDWQGRA
jgi:phage shock protein B